MIRQLSCDASSENDHRDRRLLEHLRQTTARNLQLDIGLLELFGDRLRFLLLLLDLDRLLLQLIAELLQLFVPALRFGTRCFFRGQPTLLFLGGAALGEIARDFGEANQLAAADRGGR